MAIEYFNSVASLTAMYYGRIVAFLNIAENIGLFIDFISKDLILVVTTICFAELFRSIYN